MALLSINEEELDRFIAKRVREGVREELAKRGEIIDQKMFNRKEAAKYLALVVGQSTTLLEVACLILHCHFQTVTSITCGKI